MQPADLPPTEELGPKMLALKSDNHRLFAWHFANNGANATEAAVAAGWGEKVAYQSGWRLKQRDDVQEAIQELVDKNLLAGRAIATKALIEAANDPMSKGHMKAVIRLMEENGDAIKKREARAELTDEQLIARAVAFALRLGLPLDKILGESLKLAQLPAPIEGTAVEVDSSLQDLL